MQFVLIGYDQEAGTRLYAFQRIADGIRTDFTVRVELALIPSYGIRIQELPLLCQGFLERRGGGEEKHVLNLTEEEMRIYADIRATAREAAERKKKLTRKPRTERVPAGEVICDSPDRKDSAGPFVVTDGLRGSL